MGEYDYTFDDKGSLLVTDKATGVVVANIPKHRGRAGKEPLYQKFYYEDCRWFARWLGGKAGMVFYLASIAERSGRIVMSTDYRKAMAKELGLSSGTIYNYTSELLRSGIIFKLPDEKAPIYWLNPYVFGYGSWDDIKEKQALFQVSRKLGAENLMADESGRQDLPVCYSNDSTDNTLG